MQAIDRNRAEQFVYLLCCWLAEPDCWFLLIDANDYRELFEQFTHDWHRVEQYPEVCMLAEDPEPNSTRMDTLDMQPFRPPMVL